MKLARYILMLFPLLVLFGTPAAAEPIKITLEFEPDLENGKRSFEICVRCHLPEAWGNDDGTYPQLAGQHVNVLMKQLLDIRSGKRQNPLMYPFVQKRTLGGYQSLSDVVAYISTLPMTPAHTMGPWPQATSQYKQGKVLYEKNCAQCHGTQGEGNNMLSYPRLQGQHYPYMRRQAIRVRDGLRKVDPAMDASFKSLSFHEIEQVLNFISYLQPPKEDLAPSINWRNPDYQ